MSERLGILTMTRGDSERIEEWVKYHEAIGFNYFRILLDNPNDDTFERLNSLVTSAEVEVIVKSPLGPYYDDVPTEDIMRQKKEWKRQNLDEIEESGFPVTYEVSWRQYKYFPIEIEVLQSESKIDWLAIIDVDEYIVLKNTSLHNLVQSANKPRLRFLNFNYDTSNYDGSLPITKSALIRWSREDIESYGKGWENRHKSLVRLENALPLVSVHAISRGSFEKVSLEKAQLNHYKIPTMNMIPYTIYEPLDVDKVINE